MYTVYQLNPVSRRLALMHVRALLTEWHPGRAEHMDALRASRAALHAAQESVSRGSLSIHVLADHSETLPWTGLPQDALLGRSIAALGRLPTEGELDAVFFHYWNAWSSEDVTDGQCLQWCAEHEAIFEPCGGLVLGHLAAA